VKKAFRFKTVSRAIFLNPVYKGGLVVKKISYVMAILTLLGLVYCFVGIRAEAAPSDTGLAWLVEPTLSYDSIDYCQHCDVFNNYEFEQHADSSNIGTKLNALRRAEFSDVGSLWLCWGHGGGYPNYMYDEKTGLYGAYYSDEDGQSFTMQQRSDFFQQNPHRVNRPLAFQKIDIDKVKTSVNYDGHEWLTDYDFSDAYISSKYAIAYNGAFVTDFIYDDYDRNTFFDTIAVKLNNKWGILDKNGNISVSFEFDHITFIDENTAFAKFNGRYGVLDIRETIVNR
jgi:hypothetical protein